MSILDIQRALKARGYDPGPLDGVWGRRSIAALRLFQAAANIAVDGVIGPQSIAALNAAPVEARGKTTTPVILLTPEKPAWYSEAERLKGLREVVGAANNPTIMGWAKAIGGWVAGVYTGDSVPWCGLAMAHFIGATLPAEPLPTNPLSALAWLKFGRPLATPALGAVMVFRRSGGGHVALYAGEDREAYRVLGGNQSDSINVTRIAKSRFVGARWPSTAPLPRGGRVVATGGGALSKNEA